MQAPIVALMAACGFSRNRGTMHLDTDPCLSPKLASHGSPPEPSSLENPAANNAMPGGLERLGYLQRTRGDLREAASTFEVVVKGAKERGEKELYLRSVEELLRLYAELDQRKKMDKLKDQLHVMVIQENLHLSASTYYVLGVCAFYSGNYEASLECHQKALDMALATGNKERLCSALCGFVMVYIMQGRYEEALAELEKLKVFAQSDVISSAIQLRVHMLGARVLEKLERFDEALEMLWSCCDLIKKERDFFLYAHFLYAMGKVYMAQGDESLARVYLTLAQKSVSAEDMVSFSREVQAALKSLGGRDATAYDIVLHESEGYIVERNKGKVVFKNQFVLLDMLKLFLKSPGAVYTKADLVKKVWREKYDPKVHNNKLYVTIKRLREMVESAGEKPRYIFRSKKGYYLNSGIRVRMKD